MPERKRAKRWEPDWAVAPAELLAEWMEENGLSPRLLAVRARCPVRTFERVLAKQRFGAPTAAALQRGTGINEGFWLALEHMYRAHMARTRAGEEATE